MARLFYSSCSPFVLLILACQQKPAPLSDADKTALRANDQQFAQLAVAKNFAALAATFTADASTLPPNEPGVKGRAAIQAWITAFPPITALTLEPQEIDGVGDFAYVRGTFTITIAPPGAPGPVQNHGKYLEVERKQADGHWLITDNMYNSDLPITPPAPPAAPVKRKP